MMCNKKFTHLTLFFSLYEDVCMYNEGMLILYQCLHCPQKPRISYKFFMSYSRQMKVKKKKVKLIRVIRNVKPSQEK